MVVGATGVGLAGGAAIAGTMVLVLLLRMIRSNNSDKRITRQGCKVIMLCSQVSVILKNGKHKSITMARIISLYKPNIPVTRNIWSSNIWIYARIRAD